MTVFSAIVIHFFGNDIVVSREFLIYLLLAAIIGLIAEFIIGWRMPFGIVGATLAALLGIWLLTSVIPLNIAGDSFNIFGVHIPLIKALIGAILVIAIWHALTYPAWRSRERGYSYRRYRRRRAY